MALKREEGFLFDPVRSRQPATVLLAVRLVEGAAPRPPTDKGERRRALVFRVTQCGLGLGRGAAL